MAAKYTSINKIDTLEELQTEKKRLTRKVELARDALIHKTNPAPWIESAKVAAGGLILAGFLAYGLKRSLSNKKKKEGPETLAATSFRPEQKTAGGRSKAGSGRKIAAFAFLFPFLRQGVAFLLDELESRLEKER